jgi:hypothetical protein
MIEKVLIYGQTIYFSKLRPDVVGEGEVAVGVSMPLPEYKSAEAKLAHIAFLRSQKSPKIEVNMHLREFLKFCSQFAVKENDRTWLRDLAEK